MEANDTQPVYKCGAIGTAEGRISIAYAANETVGNIPVVYGFKQSAIDDMKYIYSPVTDDPETTGLGKTVVNSGDTGCMCNVCGEIRFSITGRSIKGKACTSTEGCTGTYVAADTYGSNDVGAHHATPFIYTFTYHLNAEMGSRYDNTNGAWKIAGLRRHYTTPEMIADTENNFDSFTGEAGNGMWEVIETTNDEGEVVGRELKWKGKPSKVA